MPRIFRVSFAKLRQTKIISEPVSCALLPEATRDFHCLSNGLLHQPFLTALQHNSCASQTALKHTTKFSRGKEGKDQAVDQNDEEEDDASADISVRSYNISPITLHYIVLILKKLDPEILADVDGKDVKIVKKNLNSLRLDSLLKAGLGTAKK